MPKSALKQKLLRKRLKKEAEPFRRREIAKGIAIQLK